MTIQSPFITDQFNSNFQLDQFRKTRFHATQKKHGRIGLLTIPRTTLRTPILFPVVCLITGTTARGGGIWKYILQADEKHSLMRRNLPILSQALHFLDFSSTTPQALTKWRQTTLATRYNSEVEPLLDYNNALFLDSGGYQLLSKESLDLSAYDLSLNETDGQCQILALQQDYGGDIVATLDYPLPPGLVKAEAEIRMKKSKANALIAAQWVERSPEYKPFLYVSSHGQDKESMGKYVKDIFCSFQDVGLQNSTFGLAVGSLVPLRGTGKYAKIVELIKSLRNNIPERKIDSTPLHAFGITGNLMPVLAYLGVDSFDSSTYVQEARSLHYLNPKTRRYQAVLEMNEWICECEICCGLELRTIQESLSSPIRNRKLSCGHYKSKYYGDIALHNLQMDFRIVEETRQAIEADELQEYLVQHSRTYPRLASAFEAICLEDKTLQTKLSRTLTANSKPTITPDFERSLSLKYTSNDFNILDKDYPGPPSDKSVLIVIPCTGEKPYSTSMSHTIVKKRLEEALGSAANMVHKVTLSGLYGPVPEEFEKVEAILNYEFHLEAYDIKQIELIGQRLADFIARFGDHYEMCLGYATTHAYRAAMEHAKKVSDNLQVLPIKPKSRRLTEFFRNTNVEELIAQAKLALQIQNA